MPCCSPARFVDCVLQPHDRGNAAPNAPLVCRWQSSGLRGERCNAAHGASAGQGNPRSDAFVSGGSSWAGWCNAESGAACGSTGAAGHRGPAKDIPRLNSCPCSSDPGPERGNRLGRPVESDLTTTLWDVYSSLPVGCLGQDSPLFSIKEVCSPGLGGWQPPAFTRRSTPGVDCFEAVDGCWQFPQNIYETRAAESASLT